MTSKPHHASLRLTFAATALVGALAATGCATGPKLVTPNPPPIPKAAGDVPSTNKAVLQPGTQVVADTAEGHIKIEAGPGLRRVFDWDGMRRGVITKPREKRFAGESAKGLYFDGTPKVWKPAHGISKLRYEEGYRNFENIDDAMIWMQIRRLYYTYNNDGLVVGWKRKGDTLQVEVWQFTIDGQKPTSLPDSKGTQIAEGPLKVEPQKMHPHLVFADGHTEPYNTQTASEYSGGGASSSASASTQSQHCSWFANLFGQCSKASASSSEQTAKNGSKTSATASASTSTGTSAAASGTTAANASTSGSTQTSETADNKAASKSEPSNPTAEIAGNVVNIRSRPSTHSKVLMQAKQGDSVSILKQDKGWRYVKFDDGRKGWVANFLLKHSG
ncbi:SH3 domain-containing protein [Salinisphaera hydrothermalis]|uniref:SH3 domain-containing protein n=1 Tax=Salinisphaera hydrothermalis TaxID=563188 RepID=UPI00334228CD